MKKWLSVVALLLIGFIAGCGFALYLCYFKTLDNDDILAYGWKGGGCGLPEVLDFRGGGMRLDGNTLYVGNTPRGGYRKKRIPAPYRARAGNCFRNRRNMPVLGQMGKLKGVK